MRFRSPFAKRKEAFLAKLFITATIVGLMFAFFRVQVLQGDKFAVQSNDNRLRAEIVWAPRGNVLDRNGELIAVTKIAYGVSLPFAPEDTLRQWLGKMAPVLNLDSTQIEWIVGKRNPRTRNPIPVADNLTFSQLSVLEENRFEMPAFQISEAPVRMYPQGEAVAHLIGYVAEVSQKELNDTAWADYRKAQPIGKTGIERQYERHLAGKPGILYHEVNARGQVIRLANEVNMVPIEPGKDLVLSLDLKLQRFAQQIFPKDKQGAIVAMVPKTGEVLVLYSHPTYDPNLFTGGVSRTVWRELNEHPARPLMNRTTHGIYPPASTWKIATAMLALEQKLITHKEKMPIACTGGMSYAGRYSKCWYKEGHGLQDLAGAIATSCNVYFYQLGIKLGIQRLLEGGTRLGFGRKTGIDLPTESSGTFPADREWYVKRFKHGPMPAEVMNLSIGQGPNSQTPLRMAQFFAGLAANGVVPKPTLVKPKSKFVEVAADMRVDTATMHAVWEGLARVMMPGGTAYMSSLEHWKMYGKTGTAQNSQDPKKPHAWFTGFAGPPDGEPEIAMAVIVEFGESGSGAAAPLAAKIADFYLNTKYGRPVREAQTLRERITAAQPKPKSDSTAVETNPSQPRTN